ncbi:protein PML isoform X3 [Diceros bicornis minor]|uniref:protein PML isoform X3 n=1 Tax=Diceros bicornis minor TaxID=77932 RepID=UPI0026EA4978|nr:protein PML isoform X3 [Diceros bicornis minor]
MQQEPAPARSPGSQQDPALPHTPTMPPPESLSEDHQPSPSHCPTEQATEEEFQFLRCQGCKAEAKCPKLLPCLHTLCSGCLEAPGMQCPICQATQPPGADARALDNVFFESLQRRLSVYRQIVDAQAVCTRCKEPADFWCFECEQLLCAKCFEAHQWFLKHEARRLAELRSQSVREFLDGTRKSNNIFCSNPNHRTPTLTSIYCRGCSKPLCCSCALLDSGHSKLKCDISTEIKQRQDELDAMTQALQEQDRAFDAAQAQMSSAVSQLGRVRAETEELIRTRVRQVVAHVREQERELLEAVNERYRRDYEEIAGQLSRLDAVLQRIRMGGALVQRMKRYASDQEVLDMHGFLSEALGRLRQEEPQSLQAAVRTDSFDEFKVRLQDLISCITQGTDAAVPKRTSPEAASTRSDPSDVDLPEEVQRAQAPAPGLAEALAETQPVAVVQAVPGAHPVPVYAYSIKDPSDREEVSSAATPQKRKSCQTECPRKVIKMESEEREARLARSSPEQPRPSTSRAVSPPHLDKPPSPKSPIVGNEVFLPNSNHTTSDPAEAEERIVVISSSEDSDAENSRVEPMESDAPHSSPAQPLRRAQGASHPCRRFTRLLHGTCRPLAWPLHPPIEQAAVPDAECPNQTAGHQEHAAVHRGISSLSRRTPRSTHLRRSLGLPLEVYCTPKRTFLPLTVQVTTPATMGPPNHRANPQECPTRLQRASGQPRWARGAVLSRGRCLRGFPHVQWLNNFFALPLSSVAPQLDASLRGGVGGGRAPQTLGAGVSPRDCDRAPMENPQVQVPVEVPPIAFLPPHPPERSPTSLAPLRQASESP